MADKIPRFYGAVDKNGLPDPSQLKYVGVEPNPETLVGKLVSIDNLKGVIGIQSQFNSVIERKVNFFVGGYLKNTEVMYTIGIVPGSEIPNERGAGLRYDSKGQAISGYRQRTLEQKLISNGVVEGGKKIDIFA